MTKTFNIKILGLVNRVYYLLLEHRFSKTKVGMANHSKCKYVKEAMKIQRINK